MVKTAALIIVMAFSLQGCITALTAAGSVMSLARGAYDATCFNTAGDAHEELCVKKSPVKAEPTK